jgi:hypothetical protein
MSPTRRTQESPLTLNKRHPGLVWSNTNAPREIYLRKALLNPRFGQLLKLAQEFGLESLKREWSLLRTQSPEESNEVEGAASEVNRILRNMESATTPSL